MAEQPQAGAAKASPEIVKLLTAINRLTIKAINTNEKQSLIFLMLNDTAQIVRYDRAVFFSMGKQPTKVLGVSGQTKVSKWADLSKKWRAVADDIKDPRTLQVINHDSLNRSGNIFNELEQGQGGTSILWVPLFSGGELVGGFWFERWGGNNWHPQEQEIIKFLIDAYGAAWKKFITSAAIWRMLKAKWTWYSVLLILLLMMFVRVPLRVAAPCEVVPHHPIVVTAPLDGIIQEVVVEPGQFVKEATTLFEYDKRVPMQELKVAQKQVEITRSELNRSTTLGLEDPRSRAEIAVLTLRLQREEIRLALAQYHAGQLTVTAPQEGYVVLDEPDQWRGKPVQVGERVMILSHPEQTKIRFWVPEGDNIAFDKEKPVKVVLNVAPERSYKANVIYIANYTSLDEKQVPSFVAEANWVNGVPDIKTGLKGTAVLYGDNVSLFYFIIRKPWSSIRRWTGM